LSLGLGGSATITELGRGLNLFIEHQAQSGGSKPTDVGGKWKEGERGNLFKGDSKAGPER